MKKILVAAGGTGGHIIPAISISKELISNGAEILFVGNKKSMEENLVLNESIPFKPINVQKLYRTFTFSHIKFPFKLLKSISDSVKIIKNFKPDAFLGTGGFVSGPVGYAAFLKKVPIFLQEQNSYPGLTTRLLSKHAYKIFLGSAEAEKFFKKEKLIFSGNPIKTDLKNNTDKISFSKTGLNKNTSKLLIIGGSQGSVIINNNLIPIIDEILKTGIEIIWQIGKFSFNSISKKIKSKKGIYFFDFSNEMVKIYNSVDFAIARAGALTIAELETKKIPSILIPLPSAAGNHQFYNALELVLQDTATIINQKDLTPEILKKEIFEMSENYKTKKNHFRESIHLNAAKLISDSILQECNIQNKEPGC